MWIYDSLGMHKENLMESTNESYSKWVRWRTAKLWEFGDSFQRGNPPEAYEVSALNRGTKTCWDYYLTLKPQSYGPLDINLPHTVNYELPAPEWVSHPDGPSKTCRFSMNCCWRCGGRRGIKEGRRAPQIQLTNQSTKYRDFRVQGIGDWRLGEIANPIETDTD